MRWSRYFIPTMKQSPQEAESVSHQLMLRAGLVRMLMAGAYMYLPLGLRALTNIQRIIREEMNSCGAAELLLPALQPKDLWLKTGRDEVMGETMIRFTDRRGRHICLGPTHEEVITELVRLHVSSYRQLPLVLYQIQTKFRDEIRPRFGVVRACEFIMKDAYSFDVDAEGLGRNYQKMHDAYVRIFKRCGLDCAAVEADSGVMGGRVSHEFMIPAESGEDAMMRCASCHKGFPVKEDAATACPACGGTLEKTNCLEIGHIFQLGTKYTQALGAQFLDAKGVLSPIIMGCYGIGVSRLIAAVVEQNHDANGIVWPAEVAPFQVALLPLDEDAAIVKAADELYAGLEARGVSVLMDDRQERPGVKFKDADLIGMPVGVVIGKKNMAQNKVEIKNRRTGTTALVDAAAALDAVVAALGSAHG